MCKELALLSTETFNTLTVQNVMFNSIILEALLLALKQKTQLYRKTWFSYKLRKPQSNKQLLFGVRGRAGRTSIAINIQLPSFHVNHLWAVSH